jgi:SAM-dependent methyltransferase
MREEVRPLRQHIYDFVTHEILIKSKGDILEIGPMLLEWTPIKELFVDTRSELTNNGCVYESCDIVGDVDYRCSVLELESVVTKKYDTIIALDVFEHVPKIWEIPKIINNLLKDDGIFYFSLPFYFYIHAPMPDYWRLSEYGIRNLFEQYFSLEISCLILDDDRKPLHYNIKGVKNV